MKKITITIGLVAAILSTKAQDTTCTMFHKKEVLEFNYYTDKIISQDLHTSKYYDVNVNYGDVLCLHFYDKKARIRRVITTLFDGSTISQILESKNHVYFSPLGTTKVSVGKARFLIPCNGQKYYEAKDGSLHTGQVSDYEQEKKEDEAGLGDGHNRKVMKNGSKNKVVYNTK